MRRDRSEGTRSRRFGWTAAALASLVVVPVPVATAQADTGRVVGTTSPRAPGLPPQQSHVCVRAYDSDLDVVATTSAAPDTGAYELELPAGEYRLLFHPCSPGAAPYLHELYDDARSWDAAALVQVDADATVTADADLDLAGRIEGRVVDGDGNGRACSVTTFATGAVPLILDVVATADDGSYTARAVRAAQGTNLLVADCGGTRVTGSAAVSVPDGTGTVEVPPLVVGNPARSVSGTVTTDGGNDVGYACVGAASADGELLAMTLAGPASHSAPFTRPWVLEDLPVGTVRIGVHDCGTGDFVAEWFDDAADLGSAVAVPVSATAATTGVALRVTPFTALHVTVRDASGDPVSGACMWVTDEDVSELVAAQVAADGVASVEVVPGRYLVAFTDCGGGWATTWYDGAAEPGGATPVGVGEAPANVTATLSEG